MSKRYEITIVYYGSNTYFVTADSESEAFEKARNRYNNGDNGDSTGGEWEEIDRIYSNKEFSEE